MSAYDIKGKKAIVTGAGSGLCLSFARMLLEGGCSIVIADIKLSPKAQELVDKWSANTDGPTAFYQETDLCDWAQISRLWKVALEKLGQIDIVCNGAGSYEPPSSTFWNAPGVSPLAGDKEDCNPGVYKTFSVNTMAPIRLAQIAIDYWLENRNIDANLFWVASVGGYVHSLQTPLYFASKSAVVSMIKSLARLRKQFGIRNAAVCPGTVDTPIFHPEYCRDRVRSEDLTLSPDQCAEVMMRVLTEPQYGDGNLIETMMIGTKENSEVSLRELPMEALYPTAGPVGQDNHLLEEEEKFAKHLQEHGMRQNYHK